MILPYGNPKLHVYLYLLQLSAIDGLVTSENICSQICNLTTSQIGT